MIAIPHGPCTLPGLSTGKSHPAFLQSLSVARLPTDPLFYSNVTLVNIVVGSRYRISLNSTGAELAKGVADSTEVVISNLPVYANPQLIIAEVRYASSSPKYQPLTLFSYQDRDGASFYVSQVVDGVAI